MPFAPGTFGAIAAMIVSYTISSVCNLDHSSFQFTNFVLIIFSYFAGVFACKKLQEEWGSDPSRVVIDEANGYWITLMFCPINEINLIIALILFRFFDIVKPLGIRKIDKMHNSAHAVMLDDVLAGIYSCILLNLINYFFDVQSICYG
jgi:phosphatidylglycerophosphatase A